VTHVLAIAQAIADNKISFGMNVELVAFAGEEQGLLGSRAYAGQSMFSLLIEHKAHILVEELRHANANISLMIQADMLAYRNPAEPLQLGLPEL
jgi:Zn-dependent M28 family amino/carboxypeptidase